MSVTYLINLYWKLSDSSYVFVGEEERGGGDRGNISRQNRKQCDGVRGWRRGLGGRQAVRSFCPSQPVDFRQEKTEMVYSEDALSARFLLRALETLGNRERRPFSRCGLSLCFLWPTIYFNEHFFLLCSVCFTVLLSSHALLSPLYRQLLINSQYWLSYILLALHLTRGVLSLIRPVHLSK